LVRQNPYKNNPKNRANPWGKKRKEQELLSSNDANKSESFGPRIIGIYGILEEEQVLVRQKPF
jgi:hypothetical protein